MIKIIVCWGFFILIYANAQSLEMQPHFFRPKFFYAGIELGNKKSNIQKALFSKIKPLAEFCDNNYYISNGDNDQEVDITCMPFFNKLIDLMDLSNFIVKAHKNKTDVIGYFKFKCVNEYGSINELEEQKRFDGYIVYNGCGS